MNQVIKSDVLVIGGGIAGCFAAIKAAEAGASVTIVDKGYVSRSGQTPFASDLLVFNPEWGHDWDNWINQADKFGEYLNNKDWTELTFKGSYEVYQDFLEYGITFKLGEDGTPERTRLRGGYTEYINMEKRNTWTVPLRSRMVKSGVKIVDRVMIADLIKQGDRVVGAVGIPMDAEEAVVFEAGGTVLCTGSSGLKGPGFQYGGLTSDGEAMAYRVGATVSGKEFQDPHFTGVDAPSAGVGGIRPRKEGAPPPQKGKGGPNFGLSDGNGNPSPPRPEGVSQYPFGYMDMEFQVHAGNGPCCMVDPDGKKHYITGGSTLGMANRKCDGVYPVDLDGYTGVPGLYVAGDTCANYASGVIYSTMGSCLAGGALGGGNAAKAAVKYVAAEGLVALDEATIQATIDAVYAPMKRTTGFTPKWVEETLRNQMMPYYILYIKKADRLLGALAQVEFMRDHLVPKLFATDAHDLRLAHEVRNMVYNAEAKLRASLFRTESRGCHYREDFPLRNDEEWQAWTMFKEVDGKMEFFKLDRPKEWQPDTSIPYTERYPYRFIGDLEALEEA